MLFILQANKIKTQCDMVLYAYNLLLVFSRTAVIQSGSYAVISNQSLEQYPSSKERLLAVDL